MMVDTHKNPSLRLRRTKKQSASSSAVVKLVTILLAATIQLTSVSSFAPVVPRSSTRRIQSATELSMSLKPAAIPLMDAGKALARSGELIIELTTALDVYGGALSAAGAQIRNAGDCVAQAAASCRFKTAMELVCDELRESGTCLEEVTTKLQQAAEEAEVDNQAALAKRIEVAVEPVRTCGIALEAAGAGIMLRKPLSEIGACIAAAGADLELVAKALAEFAPEKAECKESGRRMAFASEKMIEAGKELQGVKAKPSGKSWLKGGSA